MLDRFSKLQSFHIPTLINYENLLINLKELFSNTILVFKKMKTTFGIPIVPFVY